MHNTAATAGTIIVNFNIEIYIFFSNGPCSTNDDQGTILYISKLYIYIPILNTKFKYAIRN